MIKTRPCRNCRTPFKVVHQLISEHGNGGRVFYCSEICRRAADRNRRRARRAQRRALADELAQRETWDDDDSWPVDNRQPGCLNCRKTIGERYDGYFCGEPCFITWWSARIPHSRSLTVEDIIYSDHFTSALLP